jgi:hypothetical protein
VIAVILVITAGILLVDLPIVPLGDVHQLPASSQYGANS